MSKRTLPVLILALTLAGCGLGATGIAALAGALMSGLATGITYYATTSPASPTATPTATIAAPTATISPQYENSIILGSPASATAAPTATP